MKKYMILIALLALGTVTQSCDIKKITGKMKARAQAYADKINDAARIVAPAPQPQPVPQDAAPAQQQSILQSLQSQIETKQDRV